MIKSMKPLPVQIEPNQPEIRSPRWWLDPFLWGFGVIFGAAFTVLPNISTDWLSTILIPVGTILAIAVVVFFSRKQSPAALKITHPAMEWWLAVGWYVVFMVLSIITKGGGILANDLAKWLWFVIIPLGILWFARGRSSNMTSFLRSVGLHRQGLWKGLLLGLSAFIILLPFVLISMPSAQLTKILDIFRQPLQAVIIIPVSFLLLLFTAGFTEEMFFRGILQSRLAKVMKSEMRSCLIIALLFGLYHLPYAYFSADWAPHGHLVWAIASVVTEQTIAGLVLGVLWMRTRNLGSSILLHVLIDLLPAMTMLHFTIR
jgi:membrane protease YdiL (CAAX protease family)